MNCEARRKNYIKRDQHFFAVLYGLHPHPSPATAGVGSFPHREKKDLEGDMLAVKSVCSLKERGGGGVNKTTGKQVWLFSNILPSTVKQCIKVHAFSYIF